MKNDVDNIPNSREKIEVTPEMIEAGLSAFYRYDSRYDVDSDGVKEFFLAMYRVHREALCQEISQSDH